MQWKTTMTNIDIAKPGPLMAGKRGLIMGVANERSIAWGIARVLAGQGAKLAFTYQGDAFGRRAIPLAKSVGSEIIVNCDVIDLKSVDNVFAEIKEKWGGLDFVVHALAFSDRRELSGRYADTTRDNFSNTMVISCFSFTEIAKRAAELMNGGGSTADADLRRRHALGALLQRHGRGQGRARSVRALPRRPISDRRASASMRFRPVPCARWPAPASPTRASSSTIQRDHAPLRRTPTLDEVGGSALYLLSDMSGGVTGEVHFVDCGYNTVAMPSLDALKEQERGRRLRPPSRPA